MKGYVRFSWLFGLVMFSALPICSYARVTKNVPPLAPVPPELQSAFGDRRLNLQKELKNLKKQAADLDAECGGAMADNQGCQVKQDALSRAVDAYIRKAEQFNADVATAPGPTTSSTPAINMGELYPDWACEEAKQELARLRPFQAGLEKKLQELATWRKDLNRYSAEFEDLRAETMRRDMSDLLAAIPASEIMDKFATPETARDFSVAYESLASLVSQTDALTTSEDRKTIEKTLDATLGVKKVLIRAQFRSVPVPKSIENLNFAIDGFAKVITFALKPKEPVDKSSPFLEKAHDYTRPYADLLVDLATAHPDTAVIAKPIRFAKEEYVRQRKQKIANEALESLGAALGSNWNAELQLRQRLDKVKTDIGEEERTLQACGMR